MIKARIFSGADGRLCGFDLTGHAGTAEHGRDIVCAGVSAISQTAAYGLEKYLRRKVDASAKQGELSVRLQGEPDDLTEAILRTMLIGLEELAAQYPKSFRILYAMRESKGSGK